MQSLNKETPLVAVFMVTYNHEHYIEEALLSVLKQETTFPFHIYLGEDCSTDTTREICLRLQEEYPEKLTVLAHAQNMGVQKNTIEVFRHCFESGAQYIAMLEGDDYWIDTNKLQKQVNFLEKNADFSLCFHDVKVFNQTTKQLDNGKTSDTPEVTSIEDLAKKNYIHTPGILFRKNFDRLPDFFEHLTAGDYVLHMLNAKYGKIKRIKEPMAVYRVHDGGIWSKKANVTIYKNWIEVLSLLLNSSEFNKKINNILQEQQLGIARSLLNDLQQIQEDEKILSFGREYPELISKLYLHQIKEINTLSNNVEFASLQFTYKTLFLSLINKVLTKLKIK
ncbi:MAG: glycosyltransferase [Cytophagales bacterium]|nr:glycosyltransferase [Cytophagales bacterium]